MLETVLSHLKLYLNSLVYHRNIFGSSSEVFGNLRKTSDIFRNFRKMFGSVHLAFGTILENFRKSSESGRKSSENHQKRRVYIIKRTLHVGSKIWILCSRGKNNISLVRCAHSWDIVLATRTQKSYLLATVKYPLFLVGFKHLYANLLLHLAANSVILLLLDNGVMKTPKRRFLSLIFACLFL